MEKISKILPSSPRIKSVDFSDGGRMRPGMPNFGVPIGRSSLSPVDKFTKSNAALKLGQEFTSTDWKVRDMAKAGMVGKLSQSFFANRTEDADKVEMVSPMFRVPEELLQEVQAEEDAEMGAGDNSVNTELGLEESSVSPEDTGEEVAGHLVGVIVLEPEAMDEMQDFDSASAYEAEAYKSEAMAAYGAATTSSSDTSTLDYTA